MKLLNALEIGLNCELTDVAEAILNIELHAPSLFVYSEMAKEIDEMYAEFHDLVKLGGGMEMPVAEAIELMNS